jgi:hypothetical protein
VLPLLAASFRVSLDTLRGNPLRTFLSTLGIVIGVDIAVASLVAALSLGDGMERFFRTQIGETTDLQAIGVSARKFRQVRAHGGAQARAAERDPESVGRACESRYPVPAPATNYPVRHRAPPPKQLRPSRRTPIRRPETIPPAPGVQPPSTPATPPRTERP